MKATARWLPVLGLLLAACNPASRPPVGTAFVLPPVGASAAPSASLPASSPVTSPSPEATPSPVTSPSAVPTPPPSPGVVTLAGGESAGFADGTGAQARFESPRGVALGPDGNLYVADTQNHRIRRVGRDGAVSTVAGGDPGYQDGSGATARFEQPVGLAFGANGDLYVTDSQNGRIRRIQLGASGTATVTTIAGHDERTSVDGDGLAAGFDAPFGLAADATGRLYVTDRQAQVIRRIDDPAGTARVTTVAGEVGTLGDTDGPSAQARFAFPTGITVEATGVVYLTEEDGCRIRRIGTDGVVSTLNGGAGGCGNTDGPLRTAQFLGPSALLAVGQTLYVADTDNGAIRRLDPARSDASTLVGGLPGYQDGSLLQAEFQAPRGLALAADGRLVVADAHGIRLIRQ